MDLSGKTFPRSYEKQGNSTINELGLTDEKGGAVEGMIFSG